ncbi:IS5 family transposase, partial [Streptomyces sp. NPDC000851]
MSMRKPYPSDLTNEQWELVEPVITAWKARHPSVSGHQGKYAMREIVNAILYQNRTGCQWEFLPHDMPPPGAVKYYFYLWRDEGTDQDIHDLLRWQLREKRKRLADPSLVVLDTQSIHVAVGVPATTTGWDAAKRVPGRKRCLAVDVLGLVVAVVVLAASAHENTAGIALLDQVAGQSGSVKKALVDQGFKKKVVEHGMNVGIDVDRRLPASPLPLCDVDLAHASAARSRLPGRLASGPHPVPAAAAGARHRGAVCPHPAHPPGPPPA